MLGGIVRIWHGTVPSAIFRCPLMRPVWIYISQTHLHGREWLLKITIAAVALVRQPFAFRPPENVLFGLPDILASAAKTERLKSHRLQGDVAGENHEVGPGDFPSV